MCVIAIKEANVNMPSMEYIEAMWNANSDGAGFMWAEDGKVEIRKGFLTLKDFIDALDEWEKTHDSTAVPVIMHFRIGTHGNTKSAECTHPFPVSSVDSMLKATSLSTSLGFAHNGIITDIDVDKKKELSDTMMYGKLILSNLYASNPSFYKDPTALWLIKSSINGSKMCFMDGDGTITKVGDWSEEAGVYYSNLHWKLYTWDNFGAYGGGYASSGSKRYRSYGCYGYSWDDDDYFDVPSKHEGSNSEKDRTSAFGEDEEFTKTRYIDGIKEIISKSKSKYYDKMDEHGNIYVRVPCSTVFETIYGEYYDGYELGLIDVYVDGNGMVFEYEDGYFWEVDDIVAAYMVEDNLYQIFAGDAKNNMTVGG